MSVYYTFPINRPAILTLFIIQVAGVVFYVAKAKFLPRLQPDKETRWDYDFVEVGDAPSGYSYGPADMEADIHHRTSTGDEWTVGSSSSISSSGSLSPTDESSRLVWEEETLAAHSENDAVGKLSKTMVR